MVVRLYIPNSSTVAIHFASGLPAECGLCQRFELPLDKFKSHFCSSAEMLGGI